MKSYCIAAELCYLDVVGTRKKYFEIQNGSIKTYEESKVQFWNKFYLASFYRLI